ncbi:MAG: anthranilate phosphoribosyltransferase [Desulfobacteraceae bacterium]
MPEDRNREFGRMITSLIRKEDLSRQEAGAAFTGIFKDVVTRMQQGAFLAALTAKGETVGELAGAFQAVFDMDTVKVHVKNHSQVVENSGTGMDTFKTFNISTAASLIAAAGGIPMARHGARAVTSLCGTVDMAEALGVDVECSADMVADSIERCGIGLFNGMSRLVHPGALGRILSEIHFGSTLNIAASLANPALPQIGVRGVYSKEMVVPAAELMKEIGYRRAIVLNGGVSGTSFSMDEASVCGPTLCAELSQDGRISEFILDPEEIGMAYHSAEELAPETCLEKEAVRFVSLVADRENGARKSAAALNAGLVYYVSGKSGSIPEGVEAAYRNLENEKALQVLENWVAAQNRNPQAGLKRLEQLVRSACAAGRAVCTRNC